MFTFWRRPRFKRVLPVTVRAYDEIAGKLTAAGIQAARADGSLDLSDVGLVRDEEATEPPVAASSGYPPGYRPINPKR